ncbi:MAG: hypothetical protein JNM39_10215 [Bdellovibrionaceae bacterium]|nr:hypothetical protein [Pseudobdellovibrionaceae bacterium]
MSCKIKFVYIFMICHLTLFHGQAKNDGQAKKKPATCTDLAQLGLVNNWIETKKLAENLPGLSPEGLAFFEKDAKESLLAIVNPPVGKAPPQAMMDRLLARANITRPIPGRQFKVEGRSDLIDERIRSKAVMGMEEERAGEALGNMGFKVKFNDGGPDFSPERLEKEGLNRGRTPDLTVNGKIFDIYSHIRNDVDRAVSDVIDKVEKGQTHRVVVNLRIDGDVKEFIADMGRRLREKNPDGLHEVLVIHKDGGGKISQLVPLFP